MRIEVDGKTAFASTGSLAATEDAEVVLFIHGAGMDHSVWVMPARHFARRGFQVFAPDLPGHCRSEGPSLATIEEMADWLVRFMDVVSLEKTRVAGHSMGSLVAYALACRHPDRVNALALVGTATPMPVSDQLLGAAKANHHAAIDMANIWSHSNRGRLGGNEVPGIWMLGAGERLLERAGRDVFFADLNACNEFDACGFGGFLDLPSLLVLGEDDLMTPSARGRALAERIQDAQILEIPGVGHAMLSESPNELLDALKSIFE